MKRTLESDIDDLYKLPLDEFTKARNALAKTLPGKDKAAVSALRKASVPTWAVNQLYWRDAPVYKALVDASEKLRTAHRAALGGRKVDTRKADELHRTTVEKAFARTLALAEQHGTRISDAAREAVRRTLNALPTDEPAGRITVEPPAAGFSLLTGIKPRAVAEEPPAPSKADLRRQELEEKKRQQEEERERKEREKREKAIKKAEQALRDAERRLADLKG